MGLEVAEIEGDAIFFYRIGEKPSPMVLYQQTVKMYNAFHTNLKEYDRDRICSCGACSTVNNLQIKFVSHYGKVVKRTIHNYLQLMGSDVTTAHKLLKNNINEHEYLLWSENSLSESFEDLPEFEAQQKNCMKYDGVGDVYFHHLSFKQLFKNIPNVSPRKSIETIENPLKLSISINADIDNTYALLTDLDFKASWTKGLKEVKYKHERVHRIGTTHGCVLPLNTINFETIENQKSKREMIYTEFSKESFMFPDFYQRFILTKVDDKKVNLNVEIHYKGSFIKELILKLIMKVAIQQSLLKFKKLIEGGISPNSLP